MHHHNHYYAVFLVFMFAEIAHACVKAKGVRESKLNGIKSYAEYIDHYGWETSKRLIGGLGFFLIWAMNPDLVTNGVSNIQWVANHLGRVNLSLNAATALIVGYNLDSILDKLPIVFPWLRPWFGQKEVPPPGVRADIPKAEAA